MELYFKLLLAAAVIVMILRVIYVGLSPMKSGRKEATHSTFYGGLPIDAGGHHHTGIDGVHCDGGGGGADGGGGGDCG